MKHRTPGQQIEGALAAMIRWASREPVRQQMLGPAARDLSPNDVWLLGTLDEFGPIKASELARIQGVDRSTVTMQVRRLERRGLVSRQDHPEDGRVVMLQTNERGRQLHAELRALGAAVIDEALASWPDSDRQSLGVLLERLSHAVQASTGSVSPASRAGTE